MDTVPPYLGYYGYCRIRHSNLNPFSAIVHCHRWPCIIGRVQVLAGKERPAGNHRIQSNPQPPPPPPPPTQTHTHTHTHTVAPAGKYWEKATGIRPGGLQHAEAFAAIMLWDYTPTQRTTSTGHVLGRRHWKHARQFSAMQKHVQRFCCALTATASIANTCRPFVLWPAHLLSAVSSNYFFALCSDCHCVGAMCIPSLQPFSTFPHFLVRAVTATACGRFPAIVWGAVPRPLPLAVFCCARKCNGMGAIRSPCTLHPFPATAVQLSLLSAVLRLPQRRGAFPTP